MSPLPPTQAPESSEFILIAPSKSPHSSKTYTITKIAIVVLSLLLAIINYFILSGKTLVITFTPEDAAILAIEVALILLIIFGIYVRCILIDDAKPKQQTLLISHLTTSSSPSENSAPPSPPPPYWEEGDPVKIT
ncbi:hypothetical protein [Chlamydia sp. 17-3921]|uniref:hypothetical protein n=1 Tax=Chlamydia sp. 17-3921 TaxID=2675798 RepID=UPI001917ECCD|nr:hypothetical protein [Chlamydia sp. 17-3921]